MPLQRRLPKRGFRNIFKKAYALVNLQDLDRFGPGTTLDAAVLREAGLIREVKDGVKLLGKGAISHPLVLRVDKVSRTAREKVEAAGGRVEIV